MHGSHKLYVLHMTSVFAGIQLSNEPEVDYIKLLPENLFVALECCLDDADDMVRLASAIALYSLERPVEKVCCVLVKCMMSFLCDVIATVVGRVDSALEASRGIFERGQVDGGAVSGVLR